VERRWGTLQDRLVSELRLAGARPRAEANAVLERDRPVHDRRFAIPPQDTTPAWRPLRRGVDLDRVCSFRHEATVLNDNPIRLAGMVLAIPPGPRGRSYRGKRVEVRQRLDRSWRVYLGDDVIAPGPATAHGQRHAQRRRKHGRGAPSMAPLPPRLIAAARCGWRRASSPSTHTRPATASQRGVGVVTLSTIGRDRGKFPPLGLTFSSTGKRRRPTAAG
jgi:hypothetical protein